MRFQVSGLILTTGTDCAYCQRQRDRGPSSPPQDELKCLRPLHHAYQTGSNTSYFTLINRMAPVYTGLVHLLQWLPHRPRSALSDQGSDGHRGWAPDRSVLLVKRFFGTSFQVRIHSIPVPWRLRRSRSHGSACMGIGLRRTL